MYNKLCFSSGFGGWRAQAGACSESSAANKPQSPERKLGRFTKGIAGAVGRRGGDRIRCPGGNSPALRPLTPLPGPSEGPLCSGPGNSRTGASSGRGGGEENWQTEYGGKTGKPNTGHVPARRLCCLWFVFKRGFDERLPVRFWDKFHPGEAAPTAVLEAARNPRVPLAPRRSETRQHAGTCRHGGPRALR